MENILKKVEEFARKNLEGIEDIHGVKHTEGVVKFVKILSQEENQDLEKSTIAAWLHDIGRIKDENGDFENTNKNHSEKSAIKSKVFLKTLGLDDLYIDEICEAIVNHSYGRIQDTPLSKILFDADKLVFFSRDTEKDYINYWTKRLKDKKLGLEKLKKDREFFLKRFITDYAKKLANEYIEKYG